MLTVSEKASIYFCGEPVDLRKGIEGLSAIASETIANVSYDTYFLFLNRKRNRIKILYWSTSNLFYWFVRSRNGVFAPKKTMTSLINKIELEMILGGDFPSRLKR